MTYPHFMSYTLSGNRTGTVIWKYPFARYAGPIHAPPISKPTPRSRYLRNSDMPKSFNLGFKNRVKQVHSTPLWGIC